MADETPPPSGPTTRDLTQTPAGELPRDWTLLEGQYTIQSMIASGGFGITYLATDNLDRDVAIKECFPLGLAQRDNGTRMVSAASAGTSEHFETARNQFLREARMLAALDHPNVVRVQTLFEENGTAYMAMDFIHGRDLQEEIVATDGPLPPLRVLELARSLLGALEYVHGQSVLHRDIKPQNIRIDRFGVPMLIDFGAARAETQARSRLAGSFQVVTDGYSPHEFYVSGSSQGPHSDLYALAATLYHVITGAAPVSADKRASSLSTGGEDPYEPISGRFPGQDGRLLSLIDRAMNMVPGDRPENAAVWLNALADARTTIVTPMPAAEAAAAAAPTRSRFVPGLLVGAVLVAAASAGVWVAQPNWISPGMDEMMTRMGALEDALAQAEVAQGAAQTELEGLRTTLTQAEAELDRLEAAADGDMAATLAELSSARAARDAAAASVAELEADLATLAATQAALEEAQAERDAAAARAAELLAEGNTQMAEIARLEVAQTAANAQIATLQTQLTQATSALREARTEVAILAQLQADLTEAEAALYDATTRASTLEADLTEALQGSPDINALRRQLQDLEGVLTATEAERDRLATLIDDMSVSTDANAGQLERLRNRIAALEAENLALAEALDRAGGTLDLTFAEGPTITAPNGTLAVLPRFSWDNQTLAVADTTGGISIFDRDTGVYQAHLARGVPDPITRLDFSVLGGYLIATTPSGRPDRLYSVTQRREVLNFEATTVTSAGRAISRDERWFLYTRAGFSGRTDVIVVDLESPQLTERLLTWASSGSSIRVAFAEATNRIVIVRDEAVEVYRPDGSVLSNGPNNLGDTLAISPIADDRAFLVLRGDGEIALFDSPVSQNLRQVIPPRGTYTTFRLSGDRTRFVRANSEIWDVADLTTGGTVGSGRLPAGYGDAELGLSTDGRALFIGAVGSNPARLIEVESGEELQSFGQSEEGYFSFDGEVVVTGTEGATRAQLWTAARAQPNGLALGPSACAPLSRQANPRALGPQAFGTPQVFRLSNDATMNLRSCLTAQSGAIADVLARAPAPMFGQAEPQLSIDVVSGTDSAASVFVRFAPNQSNAGQCNTRAMVSVDGTVRMLEDGTNSNFFRFDYPRSGRTSLDVWLISNEAGCGGTITLQAL